MIVPCAVWKWSIDRGSEGGATKAPDEITDVTSTGRKRAAMLAPILRGMVCEWAGLRNAGGGAVPIVGCAGNRLSDVKGGIPAEELVEGNIHHGPDKNTINNAPGTNLHRICPVCHNRWHAANDEHYHEKRPTAAKPWVPSVPYFPHDPTTEATLDEMEAAEAWWATPKPKRGPFPVEPVGLRKFVP